MLIEKRSIYSIKFPNDETLDFSKDQLLALSLWLVLAYNDKDVAPLSLIGARSYVYRDGETIRFRDDKVSEVALSIDSICRISKEIRLILKDEGGIWCPDVVVDTLKEKDEVMMFVGFFPRLQSDDVKSILPVGLRYSFGIKSYYGVKTKQPVNMTDIVVGNYDDFDLSLGKI